MNKNDEGALVVEMGAGNSKLVGGGEKEAWNLRIMRHVLNALPIDHSNKDEAGKVAGAVFSGMVDLKSADPIEGMLASQIVVAHEAALAMFSKAWAQPPEYFEARTRYLALADKAQRTLVLLTERLDRHRNSGQQQITVKHQHVTVNAFQAIVGNVTGGGGLPSQSKEQPHAITYAPGITLPSQDKTRELVPVACDEERPLPDARRDVTGRTKGK